jgi:beta-N-acetylhexosaminidase
MQASTFAAASWSLAWRAFCLLALALFMTPTQRAQKPRGGKSDSRRAGSSSAKWVASTLRRMTLREKLGQLLVPGYFGEFTSTESSEFKELVRQVEADRVGGFMLAAKMTPVGIERSHAYPAAALVNELQRRAKVPLLFSADFERGTTMRLAEGTGFPFAMAIAAGGRSEDAYTVGQVTAREARAIGVRWIFAPDADVNDNPENPIINIRSFGEDPAQVAEYVKQFTRGIEENGALATAKHFPGHGDVTVDSHLGLPTVSGDLHRLENVELVPFRAAIAAHVSTIMSGHLAVPSIEPDTTLPATLSHRVLTDLLRKQMGFEGLIVADGLEMGGISGAFSPGEAAVRAIEAGVDVLLLPQSTEATLVALEDAVQSGRLSESRIDESVRRILTAKARVGLDHERFVDLAALGQEISRPENLAAAQTIADRGVTLLRDEDHLLPIDATRAARYLLVALSADPDPYPGEGLEKELRRELESLTVLRADSRIATVDRLELPAADSYDAAIVALYVRVADGKGQLGLPPAQAEFLNRLLAQKGPVIVVCFGNPYLIARFPGARTWLAEFSTNDVAERAAGRAVLGQVPITGHIPVTVPGVSKRGDGVQLRANPMTLRAGPDSMAANLQPAFRLLDRAVADRAFPGGVLAIGWKGQMVVHPFGTFGYEARTPAVQADTIYDMASLTKPMVTTTGVMILAQQRLIQLDAPVARYLPEWAAGPNPDWRAGVTVRQLLLHTAGLPPFREYFRDTRGKKAIITRVMTEPLVYQPGTKIEYSDLGFILLGTIVERLTGVTLDQFATKQIFAPLGMADSMFNPSAKLAARIAPTEMDEDFRHKLLRGEVHDPTAWAMGGVAGHAGLFSSAGDVALFAQMMLDGGIYAHQRLLARATIREFTTRTAIGDSARALGWDVPTSGAACGHYFSTDSFGHLGFTGTSIWIDPEKELFVALLTNRVNPSAQNLKIHEVRPALHDAILHALSLAAPLPAR